MSQFTPMNVEQSIAKYVADKFKLAGYKIYWRDTGQREGTGAVEVTILRDFPTTANLLVQQDAPLLPGQIRAPAFAVIANSPTTGPASRLGIGESIFEWNINVRIDGFADTELQWYKFQTMFKEWFHPDVRLDLLDQEANINTASPTIATQKMHLGFTQVFRRELEYDNAARYYLFIGSIATFIE